MPRLLVSAAETWLTWPGDPRHVLDIGEVAELDESPERLPAAIASAVYQRGETGMGYFLFRLRFRDGSTREYATGTMVDFIEYPPGLGPGDVAGLEAPTRASDASTCLEFEWCLFSESGPEGHFSPEPRDHG